MIAEGLSNGGTDFGEGHSSAAPSTGSSNRRKQFRPARVGGGTPPLPHLFNNRQNEANNATSSLSPPLSSPSSSPNVNGAVAFASPVDFTGEKAKNQPSVLDLSVTSSSKSPASSISGKEHNLAPFDSTAVAVNNVQNNTLEQGQMQSTTTVDFCPYCKKSFCNKYYLRKHLKDIHRLELPRPPRGQALDISASSTSAPVVDSVLQSTGLPQISPPTQASPVSAAIQQFLSPPPESTAAKTANLASGLLPWMDVANQKTAADHVASSSTGIASKSNPADDIFAMLMKSTQKDSNSLRLPPPLNLTGLAGFNFGNFANIFGNNASNQSSSKLDFNLLRDLATAAGLNMGQQLLLGNLDSSSAATSGRDADLLTKRLLSQQAAFEAAAKLVTSANKAPSSNASTTSPVHNQQQQQQIHHQNSSPSQQTSPLSTNGSASLKPVPNGVVSTASSNIGGSSSSSNITERVECDICHKLVCNKYFLRAHKFKIHHIRDPRLPPKWARIAAEMDRQAAVAASGQGSLEALPLQIATGEDQMRAASTPSSHSSLSPNTASFLPKPQQLPLAVLPQVLFVKNEQTLDQPQQIEGVGNGRGDKRRRSSSSISSLLALAMKKVQQRRHLNGRFLAAASSKSIVLAKARQLAKFMCRPRLNADRNGSIPSSQQQEFFVEAVGDSASLLALPTTMRLPVGETISTPITVQLRLVPRPNIDANPMEEMAGDGSSFVCDGEEEDVEMAN